MSETRWGVWRKVCNAVKDGTLKRKPCACGARRVLAHHDDYSRPLDVTWMCYRCHIAYHRALGGNYGRPHDLKAYPRIETSVAAPVLMPDVARALDGSKDRPYSLSRSGALAIHEDTSRGLGVTIESLQAYLSNAPADKPPPGPPW